MKKFVKVIILVAVIVLIYSLATKASGSKVSEAADSADAIQEVAKKNNIPPNDPAVLAVAAQEAAKVAVQEPPKVEPPKPEPPPEPPKVVLTPAQERCAALKRGDDLYFNDDSLKMYIDKAVALKENPQGVWPAKAVKDSPTDFCSLKAGDVVYKGCNYVYASADTAFTQCGINIKQYKWDPRVAYISQEKVDGLKWGDLAYFEDNRNKVYIDKGVGLSENPSGVWDTKLVKNAPTDFSNLKPDDLVYKGCNYTYPSPDAAFKQCGVNIKAYKWDPRSVN